MKHDIKCETAKTPPSKCKCHCGGRLHGILRNKTTLEGWM
jgi:hypothetical protein